MVDIVSGQTLRDVWRTAVADAGDHPFLVYVVKDEQPIEYSYRQFDAMINQAAHVFAAHGLGLGSRVLVQIGNSAEFVQVLFGLTILGATVIPVDLSCSHHEIQTLIDMCDVKAAVIDDCCRHLYEGLDGDDGPLSGGILTTANSSAKDSLSAACVGQPVTAPHVEAFCGDTIAEILFTSGTTGRQKGVVITHANLIFSGQYTCWQVAMQPRDRLFTSMPACHSNFQMAALMPVLVAEATLILTNRFSASRCWTQVRETKATIIQLIAMMVRTMLVQDVDQGERDHDVREVLYFMPLPTKDKEEFEKRFGVRFMNSYGLTESIGWSVTDLPTGPRRWPSVGRAGLGYEVGIFDDDGRELGPGEVGEFRIHGKPGVSLMLGYFNDPEMTKRYLTDDGWLRTSDVGYYDEDGWFYFMDRAKQLIKRSGLNISTVEVEQALLSHPQIVEAAVVGVPDPVKDQAVKAFVTVADGSGLTPEEIIDYCRTQLMDYKVPQFVEITSYLPKTRSMKIEKQLLQQSVGDGDSHSTERESDHGEN